MTQIIYDFPLPNNGERYDLSQEELCNLLNKTYYKGFQDGQNSAYTVSSEDYDIDWWDKPLTMSNDQWR